MRPTLKGGEKGADSKQLLTGVKAFLRSKGKIPAPVPLSKRNKLSVDGVEPDRANWKESTSQGAYLISTAIMQLKAKRDPEIESLLADFAHHYTVIATTENCPKEETDAATKMLGYTACWAEEAFRVTALTGSGTGFQQQGSSIDVIFSSYFWLYKMGCRGYQMFEELNGLLVGISQSPQGKGKTAKVLEEMGTPVSRSLVLMMSKSTEVHLPPFILNSSRLYDLVAIFGTFPVDDVRCDGLEGFSCSPRFVLNLKREGGEGLAMIGKTWNMWSGSFPGRPKEGEISEAEHLFHQFLLQKRSPFQNKHKLTGNALNVEIVPTMSETYRDLDAHLSEFVRKQGKGSGCWPFRTDPCRHG